MLRNEEVVTFVNGAVRYFEAAAQQPARVGSPYLALDRRPGAYEYTGVISISGTRQGLVYFTAPRAMLAVLLMCMQETDLGETNLRDLVGEVANTISGNAREDFGKEFLISVPEVFPGPGQMPPLPEDAVPYVIPINWRTHAAKLVVCLQ